MTTSSRDADPGSLQYRRPPDARPNMPGPSRRPPTACQTQPPPLSTGRTATAPTPMPSESSPPATGWTAHRSLFGVHGRYFRCAEHIRCAWIFTRGITRPEAFSEAVKDGRPPGRRRVPGPGPASPRTAAQAPPRRRALRRWVRARRPAQAGPGRGCRTSGSMLAVGWLAWRRGTPRCLAEGSPVLRPGFRRSPRIGQPPARPTSHVASGLCTVRCPLDTIRGAM